MSSALPSDRDIATNLRQMVTKDTDLDTVTIKKLIDALTRMYNTDINLKKDFIKREVDLIVREIQHQRNQSDEDSGEETKKGGGKKRKEPEPKQRKEGTGLDQPYMLSPKMSKFIGAPACSRKTCTRILWDYIRAHQLQCKEKGQGKILNFDGLMEDLLGVKSVDMMQMAKLLGPHLTNKLTAADGQMFVDAVKFAADDAAKRPVKEKKPRKVKKNKKKSTGEERKRRADGGGLTKPMILSDKMARFMGLKIAARTAVTKQLWIYIKEHNLQKPENKRAINMDATLKNLFGNNELTMFTMNKLLNMHLTKIPKEEGEQEQKGGQEENVDDGEEEDGDDDDDDDGDE